MKRDISIIAPWVSDTDWSGGLVGFFSDLVASRLASVIVGARAPSVGGAFDYLRPKLRLMEQIVDAAHAGRLGRRVILIDAAFVNLPALRSLVGEDGEIIALIHGGAFQPHDFVHQFMPNRAGAMARYEEGALGLCDRLIVPTTHARTLFLASHPTLADRLMVVPYPLRQVTPAPIPWAERRGAVYTGRMSFEKGADIVARILETNVELSCVHGLGHTEYIHALSRRLCVLSPARAELYGYAAIEAVQAGVVPVVPRGLSYLECIDVPDWLYLSHPVGAHTPDEFSAVFARVTRLGEMEHAAIVRQAQARLRDLTSGLEDRFLQAVAA